MRGSIDNSSCAIIAHADEYRLRIFEAPQAKRSLANAALRARNIIVKAYTWIQCVALLDNNVHSNTV